jgi:hypothetical protein
MHAGFGSAPHGRNVAGGLDPSQAERTLQNCTLPGMTRDTWLIAISLIWLVLLAAGTMMFVLAQ